MTALLKHWPELFDTFARFGYILGVHADEFDHELSVDEIQQMWNCLSNL